MKKIILFVLIAGLFYFYINRNSDKSSKTSFGKETIQSSKSANYKKQKVNLPLDTNIETKEAELMTAGSDASERANQVQPKLRQSNPANKAAAVLTYVIDDGLAVTQGDIIIGEAPRDTLLKSLSGNVNEPGLQIWPTTEIPYYIQPNLSNPERVLQGMGNCKSYLGYIGGHQKIVLSTGCGPKEIAHEIMHSLGFLHEQNRTDRDNYVDVLWGNINPKFVMNFEKFSNVLMTVSGLSSFDFESIMIYPETMFSINDQPTMKSKLVSQSILPKDGLSSKDIERINKTY